MANEDVRDYPCALCGGETFAPIACVAPYTNGQILHVCEGCGLVQVPRRRSAATIAAIWSDEVFADAYTDRTYTARIPHVLARQTFVAATINDTLGLKGKRVCEIGAGEGQFLEILRGAEYGADVFGIEPSARNCESLAELGIENFCGTIEDWRASDQAKRKRFDIVAILWTLENTSDPRTMLEGAHEMLAENGHVVVATGSRILVPFKKPLSYYLGRGEPVDQHPFHFSANTLEGLLAETGFRKIFVNRYIDNDILCVIARKSGPAGSIPWRGDDWRAVVDFFERWHRETRDHYADA